MMALSELAAGTQAMTGIECEFLSEESVLLPDTNGATHLYRIAQEAVNNALKHARARKIGISLTEQNGSWKMSVTDDGRGFSAASEKHSGLGLRLMKYRAQLIGASLETDSAPGKGVRVTCTLRKPS
jgi:signal transduction histidine kinase